MTLAALGLVVAMWVSGDIAASGTAIRQWITVALSAKYYAVGWLAPWVFTLLFCSPRYVIRYRNYTRPAGSGARWRYAGCGMRWTLLIQVQTVPKFNAQFNLLTRYQSGTMAGWLFSAPSACG